VATFLAPTQDVSSSTPSSDGQFNTTLLVDEQHGRNKFSYPPSLDEQVSDNFLEYEQFGGCIPHSYTGCFV
jgi:hypothetical protein